MAGKRLYRVYVDEAGDRGWGGRSSPVFVLSAVIVRDEDVPAVKGTLNGINQRLGKPPGTVLHWAQNVKQHSQRKFVASELAKAPIATAFVVVMKKALIGSGSGLSDPARQYNYAVRRLLERVTWYVDDRGGEAIITFAHVRRFPYEKLHDYLSVLKGRDDVQIRWQAIRGKVRINQPNRVRLLQAADLAAGCLFAATRPDDFGDFEVGYLTTLVPTIYIRGHGRVTSYGVNVIGPNGCMPQAYPWWAAFEAACHSR